MKKSPEDYVALQEKYTTYTKGNKFLTIPKAIDVVTIQTISLLTTNVAIWQFIGVSRDTMKEALKVAKYSQRFSPRGLMPCGTSYWQMRSGKEIGSNILII